MTRPRLRCAAALLAVTLAGCGDRGASGEDAAPATTAPPSTTVPAASTSPSSPTTAPAPAPGPDYTQRDGLVLIEAVAAGDPGVLLRDLQALGLRDGVVVGRVVNGWLPVAAFASAQRLASLQFVRPTGAGTG